MWIEGLDLAIENTKRKKRKMTKVILELHAVRNKEGKWFRSRGQHGWGEHWVDELKDAKIYTKIGQAKARVSFYANHFPKYGIPDLVTLQVTKMVVIDQTARVKKVQQKNAIAEQKNAEADAKYALENAQKRLEEAQKEIRRIERDRKK